MEKESYQKRYNGEVSCGPLTVILDSCDGSPTVCGPGDRKDSGSLFPNIWEKEQKTVKKPPKKPGATKFPPLPVRGEAGNSLVC